MSCARSVSSEADADARSADTVRAVSYARYRHRVALGAHDYVCGIRLVRGSDQPAYGIIQLKMCGKKQAGFTIIETMLFLGITALIMSVMLVGVGTQLNQRRYQDASSSLRSYIQNQYNFVSNVNSSRAKGEICLGNKIMPDDGSTGESIGTSDCTIVGRLLVSINGGTGISSTPVIATEDATRLPLIQNDPDTKVLHDAKLARGLASENYDAQWGTKLVKPTPDNAQPATFSILIVRMPTTGVIHTYASNQAGIDLVALVSIANSTADFRICLDPVGLLGAASQPAGTLIKANAANTSGIDYVSQGDC